MTKRMLIDASHPEETRVVVLDGTRLDDFDIEAADRLPLKGNIYLAKVVRVEPSLQAAFVEYGGNRHGFLAFGEIHPDYYQIPVADRQRLLAAQAAEAAEDAEQDEIDAAHEAALAAALTEAAANGDELAAEVLAEAGVTAAFQPEAEPSAAMVEETAAEAPVAETSAVDATPEPTAPVADAPGPSEPEPSETPNRAQPMSMNEEVRHGSADASPEAEPPLADLPDPNANDGPGPVEVETGAADTPPPETLGGEAAEEEEAEGEQARERRVPNRYLRHYKIQEVIRRRQIMLVQVVKEERGGKGAALTTYISLAGRYSVLMPNSPRGGGVSRKITSATDRRRLREIVEEVNLPEGMSLIVRTAGAARPKPEIKRDCEYLVQLWDHIRERTLASAAPALIYEEADLLKRSVRDVYNRDFDEIVVAGEDAWKEARDFMRMLMPGQERKIRLYQDPLVPLFAKNGVEQILDAMMSPTVQLKSGGYLVINQTEALVAIDVNSGRATRDRHIEDTALRTNLEAAEEVARQVRLRDLAGLIVIDFIDMESARNDAAVERKLKESLRFDRARIQVGRISHFGLLEMSRQRLRPSLTEHAFQTCPHCQGLGIVRSPDSAALQVLRGIEEEGARRRASEIRVHLPAALAIHMLNRKRDRLVAIEQRTGMCVLFEADPNAIGAAFRIERTKAANPNAPLPVAPTSALKMDYTAATETLEEMEADDLAFDDSNPAEDAAPGEDSPRERDDAKRGRGGRRRRGGRREEGEARLPAEARAAAPPAEPGPAAVAAPAPATAIVSPTGPGLEGDETLSAEALEANEEAQRRRRRRRGGRRRREEVAGREGQPAIAGEDAEGGEEEESVAAPVAVTPSRYIGPTPADPFAGTLDDIFDVMAQAEAAAEAAAEAEAASPAPRRVVVPITEAPPPSLRAEPEPVAPESVAAVPEALPTAPPAEPSNPEAVAGPAIKPIVIGGEADAAPAKKGWWKR